MVSTLLRSLICFKMGKSLRETLFRAKQFETTTAGASQAQDSVYAIHTLLVCDWPVQQTANKPQAQWERNVVRLSAAPKKTAAKETTVSIVVDKRGIPYCAGSGSHIQMLADLAPSYLIVKPCTVQIRTSQNMSPSTPPYNLGAYIRRPSSAPKCLDLAKIGSRIPNANAKAESV